MIAVLYVPYCALVWRLRGGAWNEVLGFSLGTNVTRLLTGILMAWPFWRTPWCAVALALAIPLGLIVGGWGPFHAMGHHWPQRDWYRQDEASWIEAFPRVLGFRKFSTAWDFTGMLVCGLIAATLYVPAFGLIGMVWDWWMVPTAAVSAFGFAGVYFAARRWLRWDKFPCFAIFGRRICGHGACTEWSELAAGVWIGLTMLGLTARYG